MIHKKRVIKKLGYSLIIIGIFLIIIQSGSLTGAVIDLTSVIGRIWFFVGLGLVLGGGIVLLTQGNKRYAPTLENFLTEKIISDPKAVMIMDTSGIIPFKYGIDFTVNKNPGKFYIPKRVIGELNKNPINDALVENLRKDIKEKSVLQGEYNEKIYKQIRGKAVDLLGETKKHRDYVGIKYQMVNGKWPSYATDYDIADYQDTLNLIDNRLIEKDIPLTDENKLKELKRGHRVSKGDVDVLSTALSMASKGKHVKVVARDSHLQQSINKFRTANPKLKPYLEYIEAPEAA